MNTAKNTPKYQILRLNLAGYQNSSFLKQEKVFLEAELPVFVAFVEKELKPNIPLILITNTHTQLEKISKKILTQTKLIIHPNSGFDNFKKAPAIPVILGNSIRAQAVSEYILSALFHHFSPIPHHEKWDRQYPRNLLAEQNILILGYGHVGKLVEQNLKSLGLKVNVYDPYKNKNKFPTEKSSVLIIAASLTTTSKQLVNKSFLKKYMKDDLVLINPARGEIVDEADLLGHLKQYPKSFAYLDVYCDEPNDFTKFKLKNLNLTSHIAGVFKDLDQSILDFEARVLYDFIYSAKTFNKTYKNLLLKNELERLKK